MFDSEAPLSGDTECLQITVPVEAWYRRQIYAALSAMALPYNWNDQPGATSPADVVDCTSAAAKMLGSMTDCEGGGGMQHIARLQGSSAVSFLLTDIPANYRHLIIKWAARTVANQNSDSWYMRFNFDNAANYREGNQRFQPDNNAIAGSLSNNQTYARVALGAHGDTSKANTYAHGWLNILNAQNCAGVEKVIIGELSNERTGSDASYEIRRFQMHWYNEDDDITDIEITSSSAEEFTDETYFDVYGVV